MDDNKEKSIISEARMLYYFVVVVTLSAFRRLTYIVAEKIYYWATEQPPDPLNI